MVKFTGHTITSDSALGGKIIEKSLRFNRTGSHRLNRTPASAGNRKTWTWSGWVKRATSDASNNLVLWSSYEDSNNRFAIQISNTDQF